MLFGCGVVVVVFISLGQCSTVSYYLLLSLFSYCRESCAQSTRRMLHRDIMLRRSCVGSKSLISLERCSTISRCLYLLLRVLGARYWRVYCLRIISLASLG
ncbi:hypothetical protein HBI82_107370 [Parastagonospora nodorum]|nr:hypothetical protein HBI82_107370 [Parastagonospora nodorum]